ncbi:MAG: caspase family protein [Pseudomonadota bacterium]
MPDTSRNIDEALEMIARTLARIGKNALRGAAAAAFGVATMAVAGTGPAFAATDALDGTGAPKARIAFVVGNQRYTDITVEALLNPVNDGKLIARSLRRLNFEVIEGYDLSLPDLQALITKNRAKIDAAEAVVFYYAGHGFQLDGTNYVVPIDAKLQSVADIPAQTLQLDAIINELENPDRPTLVFMDACRENPLPPSVEVDKIDGLAQIEAGTNTFIAFSTELGKVSYGGTGKNSPFAIAMATHLETPGQSVSDFMIEVRNETQALTLDRQTPWTQESLQAQFYFTERQELNKDAINVALAKILDDPRRLQAFQRIIAEENLSLQAAIFRERQRSVDVVGQRSEAPEVDDLYFAPAPAAGAQDTASAEEPVSNIEIASTRPTEASADPGVTNEAMETLMFARLNDDGSVAVPSPEELASQRRDLARRLQTELQRLGCYRMGIDGLWGPGSRRALKNYLTARKVPSDDLDPSLPMLNRTSLDSGRVCRAPVIIKRKKPTTVARTTPQREIRRGNRRKSAVKPFRRRAAQGQSRAAQRSRRTQRRQALPPDIRMGVGIGL